MKLISNIAAALVSSWLVCGAAAEGRNGLRATILNKVGADIANKKWQKVQMEILYDC